jgi:hypothetical protein
MAFGMTNVELPLMMVQLRQAQDKINKLESILDNIYDICMDTEIDLPLADIVAVLEKR